MVTRAGLRAVSTYAQAIGPSRERVLRSAAGQDLPGKAPLVHEAHRAELSVFCWTLRAENAFLPEHLRRGKSPHALGNAIADAMALLDLGVDGLITDSPDHAVRAVRSCCPALARLPERSVPDQIGSTWSRRLIRRLSRSDRG